MDVDYRSQLRELNELNFARFSATMEQRFAVADASMERRLSAMEMRADARFNAVEARVATNEVHVIR